MTHETETKVLEVNFRKISEQMKKLGAKKVLNTKFSVDWFRPKGERAGKERWFLRLRKTQSGEAEITWKGRSNILGTSRQHKEINFAVFEPQKIEKLFVALGLEKYAHQEKYRTAWTYRNWKFDLDRYPGMPAYLEIEGQNERHIQEALKLLGLDGHETSSEGERILIQSKYHLNWYQLKF